MADDLDYQEMACSFLPLKFTVTQAFWKDASESGFLFCGKLQEVFRNMAIIKTFLQYYIIAYITNILLLIEFEVYKNYLNGIRKISMPYLHGYC